MRKGRNVEAGRGADEGKSWLWKPEDATSEKNDQ